MTQLLYDKEDKEFKKQIIILLQGIKNELRIIDYEIVDLNKNLMFLTQKMKKES